jgi:hypothetical protein
VGATALGDALLTYAEEGFEKGVRQTKDVRRDAEESDPDVGTGSDDEEGPSRTPGGSNEDTAINAPVPKEPTEGEPKSLFWDPFAIVEQLGYKERPSNITYGTLQAMVWKMPIIQAIVQTRVGQVAAFSTPQHDRYQLGYRIKLRDSQQEPTKQDKVWMEQAESMIMRTGVTNNPRGRDSFETFLRKISWDSLVYDQMCFEVVPSRDGIPSEWYAVDAATMRIADSATTYVDEDDTKAVRYVQIYDGMIIAEYTQEELCFGVRNPRTDIRLFGYGTGELEMLVNCITALLWAWEYNKRFFSQGTAPKGLLNFKGAVPEKQLKSFRRHWYQMLAGVENAWRTPITNADDLQWVNMQNNNRDMEYNAWMDFLIKVACSMFQMDPVEVNFKYGNTGQKGGLQEANNKEKIIESKERGLRPLLRFISQQINRNIIWPMNENFEFTFVGLDAKTQDDVANLNQKRVKTMMMVDELRAEDDLPPLKDGLGEVILDPTWLQYMQAQQMAEQGGMEGGPGGFGEAGGEEGGEEGEGQTFGDVDFEALMRETEGGKEGGEEGEEEAAKSMRHGKLVVDLTL